MSDRKKDQTRRCLGFAQFVSSGKGRADVAGVGDNKRTERIARNSVQFVQDPASWAMMNQFPVCNLLSPSSISTTPLLSRLPPSDVFAFCDRRRGGKNQRTPLATSSLPRG